MERRTVMKGMFSALTGGAVASIALASTEGLSRAQAAEPPATNTLAANHEIVRMMEITRLNSNYLAEFMTPGRSHSDALDAAISNIAAQNNQGRNRWLILPQMTLILDRNVIIPSQLLVCFVGAGSSEQGTIIKPSPTGKFDENKGLFDFASPQTANIHSPSFVNLQLDGRLGADKFARMHGIRVVNGAKVFWSNLEIQGFDGAGVWLDSCQDSDFHNVSLHENGRSRGVWNDFTNMSNPEQMAFAQIHINSTTGNACNHLRFWGGMWERQRTYASCYLERASECKFYAQHHEFHAPYGSVHNYPHQSEWKWGSVFRVVGAEASIDRLGIFDAVTNGVENMITSHDTYGLIANISNVHRGRSIRSNAPNTLLNIVNSNIGDIELHNSARVSIATTKCQSFKASMQQDMVTNGMTCEGNFSITGQPAYSPVYKRHVHRDLFVSGDVTVSGSPMENIDLIDIAVGGNLHYNANASTLQRPKVRGTSNITSQNTGTYIPGLITRQELFGPDIPTEGVHSVGSICWNSQRAGAAAPAGWICRAAGAPGIWDPFGAEKA